MSFRSLFSSGESPDAVYILQSGEVVFYLTNHDKYKIKGNNFIIGAEEIILSSYLEINTPRLETAVYSAGSQIKQLKKELFLEQFNNYSYILNASTVMAQKIALLNQVIKKTKDESSNEGSMSLKSACSQYYKIAHILCQEYDKRRLPWLKEVAKKYSASITYLKGEAYTKADKPVLCTKDSSIHSKSIELARGEILFNEGDSGNDLYILQSGTIEVLFNGERLAKIDEAGSFIGEMSLLLGEKRSATLRASSEAIVTKVDKNDLKEISKQDLQPLTNIAYSLAKKYYNCIHTIKDLNFRLLKNKLDDEENGSTYVMERNKAVMDLEKMKTNLSDLIYKQKADFLKQSLEAML